MSDVSLCRVNLLRVVYHIKGQRMALKSSMNEYCSSKSYIGFYSALQYNLLMQHACNDMYT